MKDAMKKIKFEGRCPMGDGKDEVAPGEPDALDGRRRRRRRGRSDVQKTVP
jgi:hypothetical protein